MGTGDMDKLLTFEPENVVPMIYREYKQAPQHQFLRELVVNSIEANATRVEIKPEWNCVVENGVYRLKIADNGDGMSREVMNKYLASLGASFKGVELHGNFGLGARTMLLPWNKYGVLILSWSKSNPDGLAMVMYFKDGSYRMKSLVANNRNERDHIVPLSMYPQWQKLKPDFIEDHGTVIVCMGDTGKEDTFFGPGGYSPENGSGLKYMLKYFNERFYLLPLELFVTVFMEQDREWWPKSDEEWFEPKSLRDRKRLEDKKRRKGVKYEDKLRTHQLRRAYGAKYFIFYSTPRGVDKEDAVSGWTTLSDGTGVEWAYKHGVVSDNHAIASSCGFVSVVNNDELYEKSSHLSRFRNFGIHSRSVRDRTYLMIYPTGRVYPNTSRGRLVFENDDGSGGELPWDSWSEDFRNNLPDLLVRKLHEDGKEDLNEDMEKWKRRVEEEYREDLKIQRVYLANSENKDEEGSEFTPQKPTGDNGKKERSGPRRIIGKKRSWSPGKLPECQWVSLDELESRQYPAQFVLPNKAFPYGLIRLAYDYPVFLAFKERALSGIREDVHEEASEIIKAYFYINKVGFYVSSVRTMYSHPDWTRSSVQDKLWSGEALLAKFFPEPQDIHNVRRRLAVKYKVDGG